MSEIQTASSDLFPDKDPRPIPISDAARQAGVSIGTIRNWIKTGYLQKTAEGGIDGTSFRQFFHSIAGREKLLSRANKSQKDAHNHDQLTSAMMEKLSGTMDLAETLGREYESSLSDAYRNREGIYYTHRAIIDDLFSIGDRDPGMKTFCDPACGSGNFIIRAIDLGFRPENIYGFDTDPVAVAISRKRMLEKTGYSSEKIIRTDFLDDISKGRQLRFDYIYTNPPWGKKLTKTVREEYASLFRAGKSSDSSALFFFAGLSCLKKGGSLGLLLPEAFFTISTFEEARKILLSLSIERLIDYGKSFRGLLTRAQGIVVSNTPPGNGHSIRCETGRGTSRRSGSSFLGSPKSIINFHCSEEASEVIQHVFSIPHITLEGKARWGLGIVTGNNKKFCRTSLEEGYMPVVRGADISPEALKAAGCFIPRDLGRYQQVAPKELFEAPEKLIYRFISSRLCFFHDREQRYMLNSANMLIPSDGFPISCKELASLLNSQFMTWLFMQTFRTHKILKGDLESLPIHVDYFAEAGTFGEASFLDYLGIRRNGDGGYAVSSAANTGDG